MRLILTVCACALAMQGAGAQERIRNAAPTGALTLQQAIEMAQRNSLQARAALGTRDAARERDNAFSSRLLPQVSLAGNLPIYSRTIVPVTQPDGTTLFLPVRQTTSDLAMIVTQRVPFTGAQLTMSSTLNQVKRTGTGVPETWSSTPFNFSINQPIMRSNTIGWEREVNGLQADVAERQYREAREDIALQTSNAFFDYYAAQVSLRNATLNAATNDTLFRLNQGRFEVGKISENDLLQSELALLRAQASADAARLEHDRALAALRLALNVPIDAPIEIAVTSTVPEFAIDTTVAATQAMRNLSSVRAVDLQDATARRSLSEARYNALPGAALQASYGYNATGIAMNDVYRDLQQAQRFQLNVQMPVFGFGARSADVQAARADLRRVEAVGGVTREQARQDAHFAALNVSLARRQLAIAAKADTVAQKRFEVAYNRYVIGRINVDQLYLAQNEKDQALLAYVQALRGYWQAHYRLRRVTLYDFERGVGIS
ncbi:MAG TPA: TolC family protein [Gemmatimonadaceae bacterium]|nr:TolC family protein [Gemmatimonadaceae bacterium]